MKTSMGEFLATLRKANGFTQQEVAEKLGVSNRTLSSWETDRTAPDLLILPAIADLYGVTVDELLRGERRAAVERTEEISDGAKRDLRKRRYAKYGTNRLFCLGFGVLGSLIFLAGCAVLLYSYAPLWLSVLLMVIGACGALACVILLVCFAYSAIKAEGIVLKEDFTEENKPYALCVRHGVASSLFWLSLTYISGAIVFLIVFFAAGYCFYSYRYVVVAVAMICLNAAFALALFIAGLVLNLTGINNYGTDGQKAVVKSNGKLLGKISGFGAIPFAIAFILLAVSASITPISKTMTVYFETSSAEEVYKNFQTYKTGGITRREDEKEVIIVPAGEYFLNFQSEDFVMLKEDEYSAISYSFLDLGNGFYGMSKGGSWNVYHLENGVTADDIVEDDVYWEYMTSLVTLFRTISVPETDGYAVNVAGYPFGDIYVESRVVGLKIDGWHALNYEGGVYHYEEIFSYDFTELAAIIFWSVSGATVIADTIAYIIKRKRTEYSF